MHFKAIKEWQNKKENDTKSSMKTLIDDKCEKLLLNYVLLIQNRIYEQKFRSIVRKLENFQEF